MTNDPVRRRRGSITVELQKRHLITAITTLMLALSTSIPALVQSCSARDAATGASAKGETGARELEASYEAVRGKLDAVASALIRLRQDMVDLRLEIAEQGMRLDRLEGKPMTRPEGARLSSPPLPPIVQRPLPTTPSDAASGRVLPKGS